jgi:TIR domain
LQDEESGAVTDGSDRAFEFDVALSFAGEDRAYVHGLADRLRAHGVQVFYDEYAAVDTWGADLYELLDEVYRKKARFVIAFISKHYVGKPWPKHERRSALARALVELQPYFLPVRLDDTELPGLRPTVGYVDARSTTPDQLVQLILQKLGRLPGHVPSPPEPIGVPRTPDQQRQLLAQRPDAWEYLLFAGVLVQGKAALEPKWRDHQVRYVRRRGPELDESKAMALMQGAMKEAEAAVENAVKLLNRQVIESAFGALGQPGDPAQIQYLGQRLIAVYEEFLDWAARVRGAVVPDSLERAFEIAATFMDTPIAEIREFIDQIITATERLPEQVAEDGDTPITLTFTLTLSIDDKVVREYGRELRRVRRRKFWGLS